MGLGGPGGLLGGSKRFLRSFDGFCGVLGGFGVSEGFMAVLQCILGGPGGFLGAPKG